MPILESAPAATGVEKAPDAEQEKEKAENDQRLLAGIQSVAPALAALNLVAGTYGRNVAIATGDWAAAIDRKLAELRRAKKSC
mgnify:CR=1 FL=1